MADTEDRPAAAPAPTEPALGKPSKKKVAKKKPAKKAPPKKKAVVTKALPKAKPDEAPAAPSVSDAVPKPVEAMPSGQAAEPAEPNPASTGETAQKPPHAEATPAPTQAGNQESAGNEPKEEAKQRLTEMGLLPHEPERSIMSEAPSTHTVSGRGLVLKVVLFVVIIVAVFMYIRSLAHRPSDAPVQGNEPSNELAPVVAASPAPATATTIEASVPVAGAGEQATVPSETMSSAETTEAPRASESAPEAPAQTPDASATPTEVSQQPAAEPAAPESPGQESSAEPATEQPATEAGAAVAIAEPPPLPPAPPAEMRAIERLFAPELMPERPTFPSSHY